MSAASDPVGRGQAFAHRLLAELDVRGLTTPNLDALERWIRQAHDTRSARIDLTVDGQTGDAVYHVEASTLDPCPTRDGAVEHVFHGGGLTVDAAAARTLHSIHEHEGA